MVKEKASGMMELMRIHQIVRCILRGDKGIPNDSLDLVKTYVEEHGLVGIFNSPEDQYPYFDDLFDGPIDECDEDEEGDIEKDEKDDYDELFIDKKIVKKLDANEYVKVDKYDFSSYFMHKLGKIKSTNDLQPLIDKCLAIEPAYESCPDKILTYNLKHFIGDLYYTVGRYDEAIEYYKQIFEHFKDANSSWQYLGLIPMLNAYYLAKKQPPSELIMLCGTDPCYSGDAIELCGEYIKKRFKSECEKNGGDFFAWALSGGNNSQNYRCGAFDCMSPTKAEKERRRLKLKPFVYFTMLKTVADFSKNVYAEAKNILKLQSEFKGKTFLVDQWLEKLDWAKAVGAFSCDEEVIFGYHTPWTWKYSIDIFIPSRQVAIILHSPEEYPTSAFKQGQAAKAQLVKEWSRVIAKAKKNYGINVCLVPVSHKTRDFGQLISECENGDYSI